MYFFDPLPVGGPYGLGTLTVDRVNLYVARTNPTVQGGGCQTLQIDEVPLSHNGTPSVWTSGVCNVKRIAVDLAGAYWTDTGTYNSYAHPAVWRQPLDGGAAMQVAPAQNPNGIGAFGGMLYWTDTNDGKVMQVPLDGSSNPTPLARSSAPGDLAVDSSGVYWIDHQSTIMGVARTGGAAWTLASGQATAVAIATNGASVFWIDIGTQANGVNDAAVMMVAK
jgi:sugar lactone lactonase YvrE